MSALFTNELQNQFAALPPNVLIALQSWDGKPADLHQLPPDISGPAVAAYTAGLRQIFKYGTPFAAAALLCCILLKWKRVVKGATADMAL